MAGFVPTLVPGRNRLYERPFVGPVFPRSIERPACLACSVMAQRQRFGDLRPGIADPGAIVERTAGIGDAPPGHRAIRVMFEGRAKTGDGLLMVVCICPVQAVVEPGLGLRRYGRDFSRPAPKREIVFLGVFLSPGSRRIFSHRWFLTALAFSALTIIARNMSVKEKIDRKHCRLGSTAII